MNPSPRLFYVLPDVAYVAELLPAKQPGSFAVHSFRQINGSFITEDEFLSENLKKLFDKLEPGEYQVVLPDFLFTNTIVNVKANSETQVKDYIKTNLLPSLEISSATHQIETFILTEHRGVYKVQLSALEKSLMLPFSQGMTERGLVVSSVVSASWSIKSVISLEPSLSVIQLGEQLYLSEHYIGLDQSQSVPVAEAANLVDTVKTLKGAEPSIQTIYLISSELVGEKLRQGLHDILPLQQLAVFSETDAKMPSYLKQIIESGMRTLANTEYQLPKFDLEVSKTQVKIQLPSEAEKLEAVRETDAAMTKPMIDLTKPLATTAEASLKPEKLEAADKSLLPAPAEIIAAKANSEASNSETKSSVIDLTQIKTQSDDIEEIADSRLEVSTEEKQKLTENVSTESASQVAAGTESLAESSTATLKPLSILMEKPTQNIGAVTNLVKPTSLVNTQTSASNVKKNSSPVIKNSSDTNDLMKLIGIGVISFVVTVGIGVGVGFGLVMFTNKQTKSATSVTANPSAAISMAPSLTIVSPTPVASPSAKLDPAKMKVLIVNATTIPGHAGKLAQTLKTGGFTQIKTGNAQGKYDKGTYLMAATESAELTSFMKERTAVSGLVFKAEAKQEDPKGEYSAVIVLAE